MTYQSQQDKIIFDIHNNQMMEAAISKDLSSDAYSIAELKRFETFGKYVTPEQLLQEQKERLYPEKVIPSISDKLKALMSSGIVEQIRGKYTYEELLEMFHDYWNK